MATSAKTRNNKPSTSSNRVRRLAARLRTPTPSRRSAPSGSQSLVRRVQTIPRGAKRNARPNPAKTVSAALPGPTGGANTRAPLTNGEFGIRVGGTGAVAAHKHRHNIGPNEPRATASEQATNPVAGDTRQTRDTGADVRRPQEQTMEIPKDRILQLLRDRGDHDNAQQADQRLPVMSTPNSTATCWRDSASNPRNWQVANLKACDANPSIDELGQISAPLGIELGASG